MSEGSAFHGFLEGAITFIPTYRVLRDRDGYSEEKMRIPSWTDRVLWKRFLFFLSFFVSFLFF